MVKHYVQAFFSSTAFLALYTIFRNFLKFPLSKGLLEGGAGAFAFILIIPVGLLDLFFVIVTFIILITFSLFAIFAIVRALIALIISIFR